MFFASLKKIAFVAACLVLVLTFGCEKSQEATLPPSAQTETPTVVATTTMLTDLAATLGGEDVRVVGIMKPGGDPHLYQPRPSDARTIAASQMVVTSGLHLEGWIDDLVRNAGGERPVIVASTDVEPIRMADSPGGVDPHFWFDLAAWSAATRTVSKGLVDLTKDDPEAVARIEARTERYLADIQRLEAWTRGQLDSIPEKQRVLITSHDAFNYFGRAYDIDVVAIQGISTEQEASQRDVANVVDEVRSRNAPAVFVETSVNPQLIEQVARETGAKVAGPLYSDSIGPADGAASTFLGTVTENVRIITQALGGMYTPFEREDALASP